MVQQNRDKVSGLGARLAALRLLDAVCRRGETLDQAMAAATSKLSNPSDRALAHNIAAQVLRWMTALDEMIDSATRNRLADDAKARMALRIALIQVLVLETPQHAAISTALPLVQGGPRRLVHGVFSTLMRAFKAGELALPEFPAIPADACSRWETAWGPTMVLAADQAWAASPPLDLSLKSDQPLRLEGQSLASRHVRLTGSDKVTDLTGFAEGEFWVQDLAASIPVRLLGQGERRKALDLCAAPGGKTMQLAAAGWDVTAVDNNKRRMKRFDENLERTGLKAASVIADLASWQPEAPVDAVLLDAPCSATGIFRRHPDVLHCIGHRQIIDRAGDQAMLLDRAAAWVKPGGLLVYAVCSLEPQEGEERVRTFLDEHDGFATDPVAMDELPQGIEPTAEGWVRTLPGMLADVGGLDGFFIARMHRKSD